MSWAKRLRRQAAAKCHLRLNLQSFLPSLAIIETARCHRQHDNTRALPLLFTRCQWTTIRDISPASCSRRRTVSGLPGGMNSRCRAWAIFFTAGAGIRLRRRHRTEDGGLAERTSCAHGGSHRKEGPGAAGILGRRICPGLFAARYRGPTPEEDLAYRNLAAGNQWRRLLASPWFKLGRPMAGENVPASSYPGCRNGC